MSTIFEFIASLEGGKWHYAAVATQHLHQPWHTLDCILHYTYMYIKTYISFFSIWGSHMYMYVQA